MAAGERRPGSLRPGTRAPCILAAGQASPGPSGCGSDVPSPPARRSAPSPTTRFETRAGVGLVFEPELGRRGAIALWGALFPAMLLSAARGGRIDERLSAVNAGIGAAGVAVHFAAWPWSLHGGVPMLDEAEGLTEEQLPAYNAVLWFWLLCSVASLAREAGPGSRRLGLIAGADQLPDPADLGAPPLQVGPRAGGARAGALEPGPARMSAATLCLSFDNLGEAAEIELGALAPDAPLGDHFTATRVVPVDPRAARRPRAGGDLLRRGAERRGLPRPAAGDRRAATRSPTTPGATSSGAI